MPCLLAKHTQLVHGCCELKLCCDMQHWVVRGFAAVHLFLMYAAVLSWLPGLPSAMHPPASQSGLQLAGLWHPSLSKSLLPVLLLFVMV